MDFFNKYLEKDRIFVKTIDRYYTYKEIFNAVRYMSELIVDVNKTKPTTIAIIAANPLKAVIAILASLKLGAKTAILNHKLPITKVTEQINNIKADLILSDILIDFNYNKLIIPDNLFENTSDFNILKISDFISCQSRTIIYSSGSTGKSKAIQHRVESHFYNALGSSENIEFESEYNWLVNLPLYHVGGLSSIFKAILANASISLASNNSNPAFDISYFKPSHLSLVATQLQRFIEDENTLPNLQNTKAILIGGSAIWNELLEKAVKLNLNIFISYGMTEMGSQIASSKKIKNVNENNAYRVLNYRRIKIINGEIFLAGECLFEGLISDGKLIEPFIDTYYPSGDLGNINYDGSLNIIGRKDNMFISGGENIHPEEIEALLNAIDQIEMAYVVPVFDHEFGQKGVAMIKYRKFISIDDIKKILKSKAANYKIPKHFIEIPNEMLGSGIKISRAELKNYAENYLKSI